MAKRRGYMRNLNAPSAAVSALRRSLSRTAGARGAVALVHCSKSFYLFIFTYLFIDHMRPIYTHGDMTSACPKNGDRTEETTGAIAASTLSRREGRAAAVPPR